MTLKEYVIKILKGENIDANLPDDFRFFRLTDSSLCLFVGDHSKKVKSRLCFKLIEKKTNEGVWKVIYPEYTYIFI